MCPNTGDSGNPNLRNLAGHPPEWNERSARERIERAEREHRRPRPGKKP